MTEKSTGGGQLMSHEYDGIREYDNPTPMWWHLIFWASIVFSVIYFFAYHLSTMAPGVLASYDADVAAAGNAPVATGPAATEESLAALLSDAGAVGAGREKFAAVCAACHGQKGEGLVGPNLTDNAWLLGDGSLMAIFKVVDEGSLAKGMPAWGKQLKPVELQQVVAYVGTLRNTNVPGKAPEGTVR